MTMPPSNIPMGGTLIGAPKIEDFPPLTPPEMNQIAGPVQGMLNQGMDAQQPAAIPTHILCRLLNTVSTSFGEWNAMFNLLTEITTALVDDGALTAESHPELYAKVSAHYNAVKTMKEMSESSDDEATEDMEQPDLLSKILDQ